MFYHQRAVIESVEDTEVGKGLKAAFRYFDGEEVNVQDMTPQAFTVFCVIRPYIDESIQDYEVYASAGKKGMSKRWGEPSKQ